MLYLVHPILVVDRCDDDDGDGDEGDEGDEGLPVGGDPSLDRRISTARLCRCCATFRRRGRRHPSGREVNACLEAGIILAAAALTGAALTAAHDSKSS